MIWLKWVATNFLQQHIGIVEIGLFEDGYAEIGFMTFVDFQNQGYASTYCSLAITQAKQRFSSFTHRISYRAAERYSDSVHSYIESAAVQLATSMAVWGAACPLRAMVGQEARASHRTKCLVIESRMEDV